MYSQAGRIESYDTACERVCDNHLGIKLHIPPKLLMSSNKGLRQEAYACLISTPKA